MAANEVSIGAVLARIKAKVDEGTYDPREIASDVYGVPVEAVTREMRDNVKAWAFPIIYGTGEQKIRGSQWLSSIPSGHRRKSSPA
jgi:hypothetical protein